MNKPSTTLIGVFVLGALALIVAAILFFGGGMLFKQRLAAVSFFHGSVAGLRVGAPVTYRGVRVGEVNTIGIRLDPSATRSIIQVNMELVPEAVTTYGATLPLGKLVPELVERGLSARLVLQSFVTGQLQVELDFRFGVQLSRLGIPSDVPEIPTVPTAFQALTEQLENLDIDATVAALQRTLGSVEALLTSDALKKTINEMPMLVADLRRTVNTAEHELKSLSAVGQHAIAGSSAALQQTLATVRGRVENVDRELTATLRAARGAVDNANTAIDGANVLLDPDGRTVMQIERTVEDFAATAARLRDLAERVDRDPAVLIHGRGH